MRNYPITVVGVLKRALAILTHSGLGKGMYYVPPGINGKLPCYCSAGAIYKAANGSTNSFASPFGLGAIKELAREVAPTSNGATHEGIVTRWNDTESTTKKDVLAAFRRTIARLEAPAVS